jgi:hypothetical protein
MWLLRSIFWLSLAFMVIAPRDENPADLPRRIVSEGARAVSTSLDKMACADLTCAAGQAAIRGIIASTEAAAPPEPATRLPALTTPPSLVPSARDPSIPVPRPRLHRG